VAEFTVNAGRVDPYTQFKFRVKWDGRYVAGVDQISALRRETEVVGHREGADPSNQHRSPGLTTYEPIVLSRGRTHDTAFEEWANKVWNHGAGLGSEVSLKDFRKNVVLELLNEAGQVALAWQLFRCWPSEYVALGDLDAGNGAVAIESLTLQTEGWVRDPSVSEPTEPAFDVP
jgi:phage tail-like protein